MPETPTPKPISNARRRWLIGFAVVGILALLGGGGYFGVKWVSSQAQAAQQREFQKSLEDFYATPDTGFTPGELIRIEELTDLTVPGGTGYRMLYGTQAPDGTARVSSGMLFVPETDAPAYGRPVVAWAHGTLSFGDDCTPSRAFEPTLNSLDFGSWLPAALQRGWVVTATDYAGVGTEGDPFYLIAQSEAQDVINSVRAARNFATAEVGTRLATFGHSQGGHSSLGTALYSDYAPELQLIAVSGAAPAAELSAHFNQHYNKTVAWGDGPSIAVSWPLVFPDISLDVLSPAAKKDYRDLADGCLLQEVDQLIVKKATDAQFFAVNPLSDSNWQSAAASETIDPTQISVPIFVVQNLTDNVVLPNTTALLAQRSCAAGEPFTVSWLDMVTHEDTAVMGGVLAFDCLQDRFNGVAASNSCDQPLPLTPASLG